MALDRGTGCEVRVCVCVCVCMYIHVCVCMYVVCICPFLSALMKCYGLDPPCLTVTWLLKCISLNSDLKTALQVPSRGVGVFSMAPHTVPAGTPIACHFGEVYSATRALELMAARKHLAHPPEDEDDQRPDPVHAAGDSSESSLKKALVPLERREYVIWCTVYICVWMHACGICTDDGYASCTARAVVVWPSSSQLASLPGCPWSSIHALPTAH